MRKLLPLLLLGLGGCYAPGVYDAGPDSYSATHYGGGWYGEPLSASVWMDPYTGFARFDLNRPANVALFALPPGGGLRMIYPSSGYGMRQQFSQGYHQINTAVGSSRYANRWDRQSYGSPFNLASNFGFAPTYIILVASERPLDIEHLMLTGSSPWLQRASMFMSNPYTATEILAQAIVPRPEATDWTVAYHVMWPEAMWDRYNLRRPDMVRGYTVVHCPGNVVLSVPIEAIRLGLVSCPTGEVVPPDSAADRPLPTIGDRIATRPDRTGQMETAETESEIRSVLEQIARKRNLPADSVQQVVPSWRRTLPARPDANAAPRQAGEAGVSVPMRPGIPGPRAVPRDRQEARPDNQRPRPVPVRVEPPPRRPTERPVKPPPRPKERPVKPPPPPPSAEAEQPARAIPQRPAPQRPVRPRSSKPKPVTQSPPPRPVRPRPASKVERPAPPPRRPARPRPAKRPSRPPPPPPSGGS